MVAKSKLDVIVSAQDRASKTFSKIGNNLTSVGKKLTRSVTLPMLAAGGAAMKFAADFDNASHYANTMMGASEEGMEKMKNAALDLARSTGKSSVDIMRGFYDVASAGFKGAEAFKIQKVAAMGATAGFIEHSKATNALVKNLSIYGKTGDDASAMMDSMMGIVDKGLLTFDDLSMSFANASSFSAALGISVNEMGSAMGYLSKKSASAEEAATRLKALTRAFIKPTKQMTELTKEWAKSQGMAADTTSAQMIRTLGLRKTLRLLREETGGNTEAMGELIADSEGLSAALYLTSEEGAKELSNNLDYLNNSAGLTKEKFDEASKSASIKFARAMETLKALSIEVGGTLLDILLPQLTKVGDKIIDLTKWFNGLTETQKKLLTKLTLLAAFSFPAMWLIGGIANAIGKISALTNSLLILKAKMLLLQSINPYVAFLTFAAAAVLAIKEVIDTYAKLQDDIDGARESYDKATKGVEKLIDKYYEAAAAGEMSWEEAIRKADIAREGMKSLGEEIDNLEGKNIWNYLSGQGTEPLIYKLFPKPEEYAEGGIVPGPIGEPVPAVVHGGEEITPVGESSGNTFNFNFAGATITDQDGFVNKIKKVLNNEVKYANL